MGSHVSSFRGIPCVLIYYYSELRALRVFRICRVAGVSGVHEHRPSPGRRDVVGSRVFICFER